MILIHIEARDDRRRERVEARRAGGRIPPPDSYGSQPPISPQEYASLPEELLDELN
jgi:hypothetical protein